MNGLQKTKKYAKLTIQSISADILFFYKTDIDFYKWIVVIWMLVILMIIKIMHEQLQFVFKLQFVTS